MDQDPSHYPQRRANYPEIGTPEVRRQIGKELKSAREFQEMSLEQVMAITKINIRFLESIEEGRWSFLPPTYVKAFIRAYSAAVGLQTDKLSNRLDELFRHVVVASAPVLLQPQTPDEADPPEELKIGGAMTWAEKHRALILYGVVAILLAGFAVLYSLKPSEPPPPVAQDTTEVAAPSKPIVTPAKPDTAKANVKSDSSSVKKQAPTAQGTLLLHISTRDTCYVKIEHGDSIIFERTLAPGGIEEIMVQHPIKLSLSNAPAVSIKVDGKALPPFPSSRKVQVINLGPAGIVG